MVWGLTHAAMDLDDPFLSGMMLTMMTKSELKFQAIFAHRNGRPTSLFIN